MADKLKNPKIWLKGLFAAAISAAAGAVVNVAVQPEVDFYALGRTAGIAALVGVGAYLMKSPIWK